MAAADGFSCDMGWATASSVVPAPRTILAGVRKLPPATVRTVQPDGTSREHVYWRPEHVRRPEHAGMSAADWRDATLAALYEQEPRWYHDVRDFRPRLDALLAATAAGLAAPPR